MLDKFTKYYYGCKIKDFSDTFRIFIEYDECKEVAVYSSEQKKPKITFFGNTIEYRYDNLIDEYGNVHNFQFVAKITEENGGLYFDGELINNDEIRINEIQYPFVEFERTFVSNEKETLYLPFGLGFRYENPREMVKQGHSEYIFADYKNIVRPFAFPSLLSMTWCGLQSGEKFIHFQHENENSEICGFNFEGRPRNDEYEDDFIINISSYPTLYKGEKISLSRSFSKIFDGDWTKGADCYKEWAYNSSWYCERSVPDYIKNMTGFQRVIMKHQYGEIFFKYDDLIDIYKQGHKYGIDTILLFGWWKGCFDNGYPKYEADPKMGGEDGLKKAIAEVQALGGKIILYSNGKLIDLQSDYFKEHGKEACVIDIDGNYSYENYPFGNVGTMMKNFGHKTFSTACFGSEQWQERLLETTDIKLSFKPDGVFYDQVGGQWGRMPLCFNRNHKHGNRAANDSKYRIEAIKKIRQKLPEGVSLGTEYFVDRYFIHFDYIHGCNFACSLKPNSFPYIQKYIFPQAIVSNRWTADERKGYIDELNYSFAFGHIFDVSIYRGRKGGMENQINYSKYIKELVDLKEKYHKYFYSNSFSYLPELIELPKGIIATSYKVDNDRLLVFVNTTDDVISFKFGRKNYKAKPHSIECDEVKDNDNN